jgi:thiol-disulfide isomerase/thioredoxin
MKKVVYIIAVVLLASCMQESEKDYVTIQGKILNATSESFGLYPHTNMLPKVININKDGTFSDTLKIKPGMFSLGYNKNMTMLYLKNGYDLKIDVDENDFINTMVISGKGSEQNNYLNKKFGITMQLLKDKKDIRVDNKGLHAKYDEIVESFNDLKNKVSYLDSAFIAAQENQLNNLKDDLFNSDRKKEILRALHGKESPKFYDYENHAGGTTSLDDLKGKYVYIDFWATWCGPCIREQPYLEKVAEAYHGKNIDFVSISMDAQKTYEKWRKMVTDKKLGGIQLWAKEDKSFSDAYLIEQIPIFVLIDPEGNTVSSSAPAPSSEELLDLFNKLGI